MKKILLSILCFLTCIFSVQAQTLYGTTLNGGADGGGTVIKLIPGTNNLTVAKSFESFGSSPFYTHLIQANNGKLYGMTVEGGSFGAGIIFSYDPSSSTYTKLREFDNVNGATPYGSLMQAADGKLYGMTSGGGTGNGVIFSFDPSSSTITNLRNFDFAGGLGPNGNLIQASDGKLYGMTGHGGNNNFGTIFSFDPSTSIYTKLENFDGTNGSGILGSLVQANDGKLYGMTSDGGVAGAGVIFSFDPSTSTYSKLKDFDNTNGGHPRGSLIQADDGKLYGMTPQGGNASGGVIFSFDPANSNYTKLKDFGGNDGNLPFGDLMQASDGKLYGMTNGGGSMFWGVIFSFDPSNLTYTKLNDFNNTDGGNPFGSLIQASNGKLYGMTSGRGLGGVGVIFSFDLSSSSYAKLKDFGVTDGGSNVTGGLVQAGDGNLYGMTLNGGGRGLGTIFSFNPSTSAFAKLKDFDSSIGINPSGRLIQASDGKLYGMTTRGGNNAVGVIFSYDPATSTLTKLKDFDGANGNTPYGSLVQASNGKLYGMTNLGGNGNPDQFGVMFSYDPSTSTLAVVKNFDNFNGANPYGSLMQASDGKLYGMTAGGGISNTGAISNTGVIFSFDPSSSVYTKLKDFNDTDGTNPYGSLIQATDGKLYGMTAFGGGNLNGVIFSFDPSTSTYTRLKDFEANDGGFFYGNLLQAGDGKLYGMSNRAGSHQQGTIFSFDPSTSTFTKLQDFDNNNGANPYFESGFIEVKECIATTFFKDADGDGYGNPADSIKACTQPAGYVADNTDCDDAKASVHPGAAEICGNGIDDNCNGQVDEDCNEAPTVTINDVSVNESQGVAALTVTLSHATTKPVWLIYYTKDGTAAGWGRHKDYQAKLGLLAIRPGSLTGTISIKIIKDNIAEPTEYFDVILFRSLHAGIADGSGRVFISDDIPVTNSKTAFKQGAEITSANNLQLKVMPNPSASRFSLTIESNNKTGKIDMKVVDVQGKLIEKKSNLLPGQTIRLGSNYRPGTYFIQAIQGNQRITTTVIKLSE